MPRSALSPRSIFVDHGQSSWHSVSFTLRPPTRLPSGTKETAEKIARLRNVSLLKGTRPAFWHAVVLYEVLSPGYHSPLTKTQIAELFRAGRLGRQHPCKAVSQKEWRTIDELFPLLKYQSTTFVYDEPARPDALAPENRGPILAGIFALAALAVFWFWFKQDSPAVQPDTRPRVTETRWSRTTPVQNVAPQPFRQSPPRQQQQWQTNQVVVTPPASTTELPRVVDNRQAQPAAQQQEAEERQRRQTEYTRAQEERARQEHKARGQDIILPLDRDMVVTVGGVGVRVKIHDNDVTTFDVWINGQWLRAVPKQKGVSHSGTDETLLYDNDRARLYYVWEPSGKLNHCLLRVRDN